MPIPYIGITDFMTFEEVRRMHAVFKIHAPREMKHRLHIGVMMSHKTLSGIETEWVKAFPNRNDIADIFSSDEVMNCLHYADYRPDDPYLWTNLCTALTYSGIGINALQLDMTWPDPVRIAQGVHNSRRQVEVILQIGTKAMDEAQNNPGEVVERLRDYQGVIHHVLLDKSMGRGLGMDTQELLPFLRAIRKSLPELGITVAGGLGPDSVHLVRPIIQEFPNVSIDAQGRLRPSGDIHDPIDWEMAKTYLIKAIDMFKACQT